MIIKKKSAAIKYLDKLAGGPLTFDEFLLAIREGEKISQVKFAKMIGLSRSHLCDIEKGRRFVSPGKAAEMARTLGYGERQFVRLVLQDQVRSQGLSYKVALSA